MATKPLEVVAEINQHVSALNNHLQGIVVCFSDIRRCLLLLADHDQDRQVKAAVLEAQEGLRNWQEEQVSAIRKAIEA